MRDEQGVREGMMRGGGQRSVLAVLAVLALLMAAAAPASAESFYIAVDVPTDLEGVTRPPWQIMRVDGNVFTLALALPEDFRIGALHRRPDGVWLLSPDQAITFIPSGQNEPVVADGRDILAASDGQTFSLILDGSLAGIPDYAGIDALFLIESGAFVLSFDVPVNLQQVEYSQSDLVLFDGNLFSLYWDAVQAGIAPSSNVIGAALDEVGDLLLAFDVPTDLGNNVVLPGQVARVDGVLSAALPPSEQGSTVEAFSLVPGAGAVPDGDGVPGGQLMAEHVAGGGITLSWGLACLGSDDYEVYEGTLGASGFTYNHTQRFCTTDGLTSKTFPPAMESTYYIVVPRNAVSEGSYGAASDNTERPPGLSTCILQLVSACPATP